MKTQFPVLPQFQGEKGDKAHFILDRDPVVLRIRDWYLPFCYFHLHDFMVKDLNELNTLLNTFLSKLHEKNFNQHPDFIRSFGEEGGIGYIHFPDGFIHDHCKVFYYDESKDDNSMHYKGFVFCNHLDQRSKTYGILRIAKAFGEWLEVEKIPHTLYLRAKDFGGELEVIK